MHSAINQMSIKFQSRSNNEAFARQAVAAFAAQLDPTIEEINDIKTAVSEAVTNCIVHAYRDTVGYITVAAKLFDDGSIQITVRDKGCGIADIQQARRAGRISDKIFFSTGMAAAQAVPHCGRGRWTISKRRKNCCILCRGKSGR